MIKLLASFFHYMMLLGTVTLLYWQNLTAIVYGMPITFASIFKFSFNDWAEVIDVVSQAMGGVYLAVELMKFFILVLAPCFLVLRFAKKYRFGLQAGYFVVFIGIACTPEFSQWTSRALTASAGISEESENIPGAMRSDAIGSEGLIHALPLLVEIG